MRTEKVKVSSAEIVVHGTKEKPYYEIKYFDLSKGQWCLGYSSYSLAFVFEWLEECFEIVSEGENKYRKKPVEIEAFQYDGDLKDSDGQYYVPGWAVKAYEDGTMYYGELDGQPGELFIKTLEGIHHASVGDYIIQGVNGELYLASQTSLKKNI